MIFEIDTANRVDVASVCEDLLETHNGDRGAATLALLEKMNSDATLSWSILEARKHNICADLIRETARRFRDVSWNVSHTPGSVRGLVRMAENNIRNLMDNYMIPSGRLGDATKDDVLSAAKIHADAVAENTIKAAFLQKIAIKMKPGKIVREVLTEEQLRKIQDEAGKTI